MTKGGIRVLKAVAKTHARARWRKGGRKNSYFVRRLFYDYAACKARKATNTPCARKTVQGWAQESTNAGEPPLEFRTTSSYVSEFPETPFQNPQVYGAVFSVGPSHCFLSPSAGMAQEAQNPKHSPPKPSLFSHQANIPSAQPYPLSLNPKPQTLNPKRPQLLKRFQPSTHKPAS